MLNSSFPKASCESVQSTTVWLMSNTHPFHQPQQSNAVQDFHPRTIARSNTPRTKAKKRPPTRQHTRPSCLAGVEPFSL